MPNYQNGKIYKIVCNITNECYIGSTCEPTLARRLATHVLDYRKWKNGKRCKTMSFDIIDREDYNIYLIIAYPCNSKDELTSKEGELIREYKLKNACINKKIEKRTVKEYYVDNKYRIKQYLENNKEKFRIRDAKYHEKHKDRRNVYNKKYNETNKEIIRDRSKMYYELNKQKISETGKEKYACGCGSYIRKSDKAKHERSNKHIMYVKSQEK